MDLTGTSLINFKILGPSKVISYIMPKLFRRPTWDYNGKMEVLYYKVSMVAITRTFKKPNWTYVWRRKSRTHVCWNIQWSTLSINTVSIDGLNFFREGPKVSLLRLHNFVSHFTSHENSLIHKQKNTFPQK